LWAASLTVAIVLLEGMAQSLTQLVLVVAIGPMAAWDRRRRGTHPNGRPPREFTGAIVRMLVGAAAVGALAWLVGVQVGVWPAAAVAGVGAFGVVLRYEHEYAAVAAPIRERLQ